MKYNKNYTHPHRSQETFIWVWESVVSCWCWRPCRQMHYVSLQPFPHPQSTLRLLKLTQFFMMNFYLELLLIDAVMHLKKVKGCMRVDVDLPQERVRELRIKPLLIIWLWSYFSLTLIRFTFQGNWNHQLWMSLVLRSHMHAFHGGGIRKGDSICPSNNRCEGSQWVELTNLWNRPNKYFFLIIAKITDEFWLI